MIRFFYLLFESLISLIIYLLVGVVGTVVLGICAALCIPGAFIYWTMNPLMSTSWIPTNDQEYTPDVVIEDEDNVDNN